MIANLLATGLREDEFCALIGEDCHLRIGNDPPVIGRRAVSERLAHFLGRIETVGGFWEAWQRRESIFVETEVVFQHRHLGLLKIPCTIIARTTGGAIRDLRFHLDPSPLPEPATDRIQVRGRVNARPSPHAGGCGE